MSIAQRLVQREREDALQEGLEKGVIQIAQNMLRLGSEIAFIVRATGLSEEQIRNIQQKQ